MGPHLIPLSAKYNANPDLRLSNGATAIVLVAANGNLQCLKSLLAMGADVTLKLPSGADVMAYACHRGHFEIVAHILQKHEKLYTEICLLKYMRIVERRGFKKIINLINQVYCKGMSPLHYAAA